MTSLNLILRKALWAALAVISAIIFFEFAKYHPIAYKNYYLNPHALYYTECMMFFWLIMLILSLINLLREK